MGKGKGGGKATGATAKAPGAGAKVLGGSRRRSFAETLAETQIAVLRTAEEAKSAVEKALTQQRGAASGGGRRPADRRTASVDLNVRPAVAIGATAGTPRSSGGSGPSSSGHGGSSSSTSGANGSHRDATAGKADGSSGHGSSSTPLGGGSSSRDGGGGSGTRAKPFHSRGGGAAASLSIEELAQQPVDVEMDILVKEPNSEKTPPNSKSATSGGGGASRRRRPSVQIM